MQRQLFALLCGSPKTGKTVSACTFPKPLLFLDFDDGVISIENARDKAGNLIVPDYEEVKVEKFVRRTPAPLSLVTNKKGAGAPAYTKESTELIAKFNDTINKLFDEKGGGYRTLVIDSLTSLWSVMKSSILNENSIPSIRQADYGTLEENVFQKFLPTMKGLNELIPNIILITHTDMEKDELTGRLDEFPVGPTRPQGKKLMKEFDDVWLQQVQGDSYVWRTKPVGFFTAGSRFHLLDPVKPASYTSIKDALEVGSENAS